MAQMSDQTGFLVQGDIPAESAVDTDGSWEVEEEKGQGFLPINPSDVPNYYAAPPGEVLDGTRYDWEWQASGAGSGLEAGGNGRPGRARPLPRRRPRGHGLGPQPVASRAGPAAPDGAFRDPGGSDRPRRGRGRGRRFSRHDPRPHGKASILIDQGR
jgi:hypothetical protein